MAWWKTRLYEEGLMQEFGRSTEVTEDGEPVEIVPLEALGVSWG